jgi:nitrate reductase gamma subunit
MDMNLYQVVTGPAAWFAFMVFFVGVIARALMYIRGLDWQMDRVAYKPHMKYGIKGAIRSIGFWLIPFGTRSWRFYPFFTIVFFTFHIGLLAVPIFLQGHTILLKERLGFGLWTLSGGAADVLTIGVMIAAVFLVLRRIALPEVRIITTWYDYLVLAIAVAPFITGFMAAHKIGDYQFWLIAHIITGEIMLIAIPFTKLSHFVLFFMSRMQLGMDYGIKRGGMKSKGLAW